MWTRMERLTGSQAKNCRAEHVTWAIYLVSLLLLSMKKHGWSAGFTISEALCNTTFLLFRLLRLEVITSCLSKSLQPLNPGFSPFQDSLVRILFQHECLNKSTELNEHVCTFTISGWVSAVTGFLDFFLRGRRSCFSNRLISLPTSSSVSRLWSFSWGFCGSSAPMALGGGAGRFSFVICAWSHVGGSRFSPTRRIGTYGNAASTVFLVCASTATHERRMWPSPINQNQSSHCNKLRNL